MAAVEQFVERLLSDKRWRGQWACHRVIPARGAVYGDLEHELPGKLWSALRSVGIAKLYSHQARAIDAALNGRDVAVVTPTASGKSLIYNIPVLRTILDGDDICALYLFPLKALGQDQKKTLEELSIRLGGIVNIAIYDGDTSSYRRKKIRQKPPHVLISNPDMVHLSLLPYHDRWKDFWRKLKFVVLDELHTYRGIFGSHVTQVMRRLHRVCDYYGSRPLFIACSATVDNPAELASKLIGRELLIIEKSGAPQMSRHWLFLNPDVSLHTAAVKIFTDSVRAGLKTIAFTQARKVTELIHTRVIQEAPWLRSRISSYRAGFLPEERREIEKKLADDILDGVISTSALEMGIDIGSLDVCILVGYPGTVTTTWQRSGRVGRSDRSSLVVLIAGQDALDQYFMKHPEDFFGRRYEAAVVDPDNREVLKSHLSCAAAELPLSKGDRWFDPAKYKRAIDENVNERRLLVSLDGERWLSSSRYPQRMVDIRTVGETFSIFDINTKKLVGTISGPRVFSECHPGAIYLHRANQYVIRELNLEDRNILAEEMDEKYYTKPLIDKNTSILEVTKSQPVANFVLRFGRLLVTERVVGYEKRRISGGDLLGVYKLDLPPVQFETKGIWMELDRVIEEMTRKRELHFMGGIHAIEHAAIGLMPLFAMCDRNDVGGISYPMHPEVKKSAIFIYDGYQGGVGLAERAFGFLEDLLKKTLERIEECECELGCPSCIHSPKCGSGNKPLDKAAAILILKAMLGLVPLDAGNEGAEEEAKRDEHFSFVNEDRPKPRTPKVLFLDVETQRSAEEVGGWANAHLMRLALAVIYDEKEDEFRTFYEEDTNRLVQELVSADMVIGFNLERFDFRVLSAYNSFDPAKIKYLDILSYIKERVGYRLSLNHLASATLGLEKTGNGLQSIEWFKNGRLDLVERYCRSDVEITRRLFKFGSENGYIVFMHKSGSLVRLPVEWQLEDLLQDGH